MDAWDRILSMLLGAVITVAGAIGWMYKARIAKEKIRQSDDSFIFSRFREYIEEQDRDRDRMRKETDLLRAQASEESHLLRDKVQGLLVKEEVLEAKNKKLQSEFDLLKVENERLQSELNLRGDAL